jgi:MOSC domain-containing protein YiiM
MSETDGGRIEAIWIKRQRKGPMDAVDTAQVVADAGIVGNANQGGRRQVTLLSREAWERAGQELGEDVDPARRRANVLVTGVDLEQSRDRVIRLGNVRIQLRGETRPCERMDEACDGLRNALDPEWRGGAFGVVLDDGAFSVGDPVEWAEAPQ